MKNARDMQNVSASPAPHNVVFVSSGILCPRWQPRGMQGSERKTAVPKDEERASYKRRGVVGGCHEHNSFRLTLSGGLKIVCVLVFFELVSWSRGSGPSSVTLTWSGDGVVVKGVCLLVR